VQVEYLSWTRFGDVEDGTSRETALEIDRKTEIPIAPHFQLSHCIQQFFQMFSTVSFQKAYTVVAKKSAGLSFYYILVKSASNDFIQVVDIN